MFPWASLISLAGQAVGGIMSSVSARKEKQAADAEAARQQAHYEAKANEDALSRSENRQLLSEYDRKAQKQVETAKNVAAITGATPEYGLAVQKAVAEGRADLMGDIAAGDSERKDKYEELAEGVRHDKAVADIQREAAKQESYANIIANSASAFGSMLGGYKAGGNNPDAGAYEVQHIKGVGTVNTGKKMTGQPVPLQTSSLPQGLTQSEMDRLRGIVGQ